MWNCQSIPSSSVESAHSDTDSESEPEGDESNSKEEF